ncbi:CapA family protein [Arcanobacterium canis]
MKHCAIKKLVIIATLSCVAACSAPSTSASPTTVTSTHQTASAPLTSSGAATTSTTDPQAGTSTMTIVNGGDILLHLSVNEAARVNGGYDYSPYYTPISQWIKGADLAICALEIPIVRKDEQPSNYPQFGAPWDLARSLKKIGYDGCALATNHSMDRGFGAVESTIDALTQAGLGFAGTAKSADQAKEIQFYNYHSGSRDVKIAHLSATTLTNGIPIPKKHPYSWNVVGQFGQPVNTIIEDAKRARKLGADLVVVSMHWGTEYVSQPIAEQTNIAKTLADSGEIDLVFGNHSHVPQPVTKLDGGVDGKGMWVVWSQGNQISGQTVESHGHRVTTGLLTTATVSIPPKGRAHVTNLEWTAVTHDRGHGEHLYVLSDLIEGKKTSSLTRRELVARSDATFPVMKGSGKERRVPPTPTASGPTLMRMK